MTEQLIKKKCATCKEERVKVLYFIDSSDRCRICRKESNRKFRKSWAQVNNDPQGSFFGPNWKPKNRVNE